MTSLRLRERRLRVAESVTQDSRKKWSCAHRVSLFQTTSRTAPDLPEAGWSKERRFFLYQNPEIRIVRIVSRPGCPGPDQDRATTTGRGWFMSGTAAP